MTYLVLLGCLIGVVLIGAVTILVNALNGRYDRAVDHNNLVYLNANRSKGNKGNKGNKKENNSINKAA